ncbi:hypothetical protein G7046_g7898 [Stylonectria norvegica]|nr:hypothetical protein G7046_g7898 [Stylonectria norvegica]
MFKKEITGSPKQKLKSSVQRSLRNSLLATYPLLTPYMDEILPKKASLASMKLPDRTTLYVLDTVPLFFQQDSLSLPCASTAAPSASFSRAPPSWPLG